MKFRILNSYKYISQLLRYTKQLSVIFYRKSYIIPVLLSFFLGSCEYDSIIRYNMGNDFLNDPTKVMLIDTLTIHTYTIMSDSVSTSKSSRIMAGISKDKMGVETIAEGYFRLQAPGLPTFHESASFDSAHFILYFDGYWHGDTSKTANFNLFYLTEDIVYNENTQFIYSNTKFPHQELPLATFTVDLNQNKDSVIIKLPPDEAQNYYEMVRQNMGFVQDADSFANVYKGFVIKPADLEPSFILGFKVNADSAQSPKIRVYYNDNRLTETFGNRDLYFDYSLLRSADPTSTEGRLINYYVSSYIENRFQGTVFDGLISGENQLSSAKCDEITMIQAGVNVRTRIDIPYIDNLYNLGIGSIIKAELVFEPIDDLYNEFYKLPKSLEMFLIDSRNRVLGSSPLPMINPEERAYAILYSNSVFKNQSLYTFDITRFVKDEYDSKAVSDYSLALSFPTSTISTYSFSMNKLLNNSVERLYIGSPNNRDNKMKLKIYMSIQ